MTITRGADRADDDHGTRIARMTMTRSRIARIDDHARTRIARMTEARRGSRGLTDHAGRGNRADDRSRTRIYADYERWFAAHHSSRV